MPTIARRAVQPESPQGLVIRPAAAAPAGGARRRESPRRTFDAPSAPPSPARELARRALDVLRRARPASPPEPWLRPSFGREVDLVRLHLVPVRTRAALASSFGREAFNVAIEEASTSDPTSIGPVHVAYALRWLELGDGRHRAPFVDWLADPGERTAQMNRSSTR